MATSGSYDNTTTMGSIISHALALIGVIDDQEVIEAEMFLYCKRQLNQLMSVLSTRKGLWLVDDEEVTLTPGKQSYTVGDGLDIDIPKPMRVPHCRRNESATLDIPMDVESRQNYMDLPNKALQATPLVVYYHRKRDSGVLYVWPTGTSVSKTITVTVQRAIQDFDETGNNPDLPKEWITAIEYALAVKIAPKYLGGVVPKDVKRESLELLVTLDEFDEEETNMEFGVDR